MLFQIENVDAISVGANSYVLCGIWSRDISTGCSFLFPGAAVAALSHPVKVILLFASSGVWYTHNLLLVLYAVSFFYFSYFFFFPPRLFPLVRKNIEMCLSRVNYARIFRSAVS